MAKIYVSSTFIDLQDYRAQVERVIRRMGHEDVAMEYYVAEDQRPVDRCLSDVAACDLYIGIFAWRYGWIPTKKNRKKISITEMEYRQAKKTGKPCLIFLLDGKAPWPPDFIDDDKTQIKRLRNELSEKHSTGPGFKSVDELGRLVAEAIHKWEKEHGYIPIASSIPEYNLDTYYQTLRKRYQTLALEGLTPPQKEEYLQIHLRSVFVEQNVRESPPPVELPKEVWEKLQRDKDVHPEDLPSGVTFDDVRRAREVYFEKPPRPVLDVLTDSSQQHTIILGDPGSGKSTLARYIMLSLIDPSTSLRASPTGDEKLSQKFDGYLPLLIELRTYVGLCLEKRCETPLEFFEHLGKTEGWALTKDALHNYLKNDGRAIVIFDGLDEIFNPEQKERVTHQIIGFANDYPKTYIIVTSRVIGYRRKILTDAGFTHFTLQDLDEKQVETFVNRWYDLAMSDRPDEAKEREERILKSFKESASIRQLAGNPMLLTIMAIIGKHQELPRERWKLYDHAASVLIQHWDVNKHLKDQRVEADFIGEDDKKELLRRLAFKMQRAEGGLAGNYIHRDELQAEFESYLMARYSQTADRAKIIAEMMIQQFRERNFILSLYGANLYGFVHRAFLEFFCASAFVYKFEKAKELTIEQLKTDVYGKHWEDQSWHEVLRLICGMIDEKWAGEIIDHLTESVYQTWPQEFFERPPWNIVLAIQCLSELRNLGIIAESALRLLKLICSIIDNPVTRESAKFLEDQIIPPVEIIGSNWPYRDRLVEWLRGHGVFMHSHVYAEAFGRFVGSIGCGLDEIYRVILDYAKNDDENYRALAICVLAIGWNKKPKTLMLLKDFVVKDPSTYVRNIAVNLLAKYFRDKPQILTLLLDRAVNDTNGWVRNRIISALIENFHDLREIPLLLRDRAINDDYRDVRSTSIYALSKYFHGDNQTLQLLYDRLVNDRDARVRSDTAESLLKYFGDESQTLIYLNNWVMNTSDKILETVCASMFIESVHEHTSALPMLHTWATSAPNNDVRSAALSTLIKYFKEDPQTFNLVQDRALNDVHEDVRYRAICSFVEHFGDLPEIFPLLLDRATSDIDHDVRRISVRLLSENFSVNPQTLLLVLDRAINDLHEDVRREAISALAKNFGDNPQTLPLVLDFAVKDIDPWVRRAAISLLVEYFHNDPATLPLLRDRAINDNDEKVCNIAIFLLAEYYNDDVHTLPLLQERAKNAPTPRLRERAKKLIRKLTEAMKKA